jgi:hypothetical protein
MHPFPALPASICLVILALGCGAPTSKEDSSARQEIIGAGGERPPTLGEVDTDGSAPSGSTSSSSCSEVSLFGEQARLMNAFDARMAAVGDYHSLDTNREGLLGNNEPGYLDAMLDAFETTKHQRYLAHFVQHADRVLSRRDDRAGFTNYRGISGPTWSDGLYTNGTFVSYLIEDGALIAPLARFASIVRKEPCLAEAVDPGGRAFPQIARAYVDAAAQTVAFHIAEDWHTGTARDLDLGYFTTPTDAAFIPSEVPGKPVPLNYQSAIGRAFVYLYAATGDDSYAGYARRLGAYALLEMKYRADVDAYSWPAWPQMPYWPGAGLAQYPSADDLSHSVLTTEFAVALHEEGLGMFYPTELGRMAHAYTRLVYLGVESTLALFIDGTGPSAGTRECSFGKLSGLSVADPTLWDTAYEVMVSRHHVDDSGPLPANDAFPGLVRLAKYARR